MTLCAGGGCLSTTPEIEVSCDIYLVDLVVRVLMVENVACSNASDCLIRKTWMLLDRLNL